MILWFYTCCPEILDCYLIVPSELHWYCRMNSRKYFHPPSQKTWMVLLEQITVRSQTWLWSAGRNTDCPLPVSSQERFGRNDWRQHATGRSLSTEGKRGAIGIVGKLASHVKRKILLRPSMGSEEHSQQLLFSIFTGIPQFRLNLDTWIVSYRFVLWIKDS